jgi:hypothetical protein
MRPGPTARERGKPVLRIAAAAVLLFLAAEVVRLPVRAYATSRGLGEESASARYLARFAPLRPWLEAHPQVGFCTDGCSVRPFLAHPLVPLSFYERTRSRFALLPALPAEPAAAQRIVVTDFAAGAAARAFGAERGLDLLLDQGDGIAVFARR